MPARQRGARCGCTAGGARMIVAPSQLRRDAGVADGQSAASSVAMCSNTTFSAGNSRRSGRHHPVDEHLLAIEQIDRRICHLAVHKRSGMPASCITSKLPFAHLPINGHARVRVGRCARRIELHAVHERFSGRAGGFRRAACVGRDTASSAARTRASLGNRAARIRSRYAAGHRVVVTGGLQVRH